jgi:cobalt-zinc-cadmium efflux system outer membrane protein
MNPIRSYALYGLFCLVGLLGTNLAVYTQASLDTLLTRVYQNSPAITGAGQYYENVRIASRTNLFPENPEIEYAYLWGSPENLGDRTDFSISQSFEFPGVYTKRAKLSKGGVEKASDIVNNVKQETLLEAKKLWIEKVYLNRIQLIVLNRLEKAEQVNSYLRIQFESGEISKLRYNKVQLLMSSLRSEMRQLEAESAALDTRITWISGGNYLVIEDSSYYFQEQTLLDSVLQRSLSGPLYQAYLKQVELQNLQMKLTRASGMPKFKTGYYSEKVLGAQFQGVQLGITIPIWENANKVKAAEGEIISAELAADKYRTNEMSNIIQLHTKYTSYQTQREELSSALEQGNDPEILALAFEAGEISLIEYFYETDLYYSVQKDLWMTEKNLLLAEAELNKFDL